MYFFWENHLREGTEKSLCRRPHRERTREKKGSLKHKLIGVYTRRTYTYVDTYISIRLCIRKPMNLCFRLHDFKVKIHLLIVKTSLVTFPVTPV